MPPSLPTGPEQQDISLLQARQGAAAAIAVAAQRAAESKAAEAEALLLAAEADVGEQREKAAQEAARATRAEELVATLQVALQAALSTQRGEFRVCGLTQAAGALPAGRGQPDELEVPSGACLLCCRGPPVLQAWVCQFAAGPSGWSCTS